MIFSKEWNDEAEWTNQKDAQRVASLVSGLVVHFNRAYRVLLPWDSYVKKNLVLSLVLNPMSSKKDAWDEYPFFAVAPNNKVSQNHGHQG